MLVNSLNVPSKAEDLSSQCSQRLAEEGQRWWRVRELCPCHIVLSWFVCFAWE